MKIHDHNRGNFSVSCMRNAERSIAPRAPERHLLPSMNKAPIRQAEAFLFFSFGMNP